MKRNIECDVAVLGGGAAGVAAAIAASRTGAKVVLIERNPYFGGQATNSQVTAYCGFFTRGENYDQVVEGIGGEVLKRLEAYGTNIHPRPSKSTGNVSVSFNPEYVKLVMDKMMQESSVEYYLHSQMYEVVNNNGIIEEIKCTDDEGTFTVKAKAFVDASGNANLVHFAGIKTNWGDENGNVQQSSLPFRIDNMPAKEILKSDIEVALQKAKAAGIPIKKETGLIIKAPDKNYGYCTIPSTIIPALDAETLTKAEIDLRSQVHSYVEAFQKFMEGFDNIVISSSGPAVGIREARRIIGEKMLKGEEIITAPKSDDSIARGAWSPEMHKSNTSIKYTHIPDNEYFSIPLGCLKVKDATNLWAAGRTISTDSLALGSVRVMGTGFATGQAAGVAAALTLNNENYDIKKIQNELLKQGALI